MKYFVRAVKYFVFLCVLISVILLALVLLNMVEADVSVMFKNGYNALWQIALLFAVIAAVYPKLNFVTRKVWLPGTWESLRDKIVECLRTLGYACEYNSAEMETFRLDNPMKRLSRLYEDRIEIRPVTKETFETGKCGIAVSGINKDVLRILSRLEGTLSQSGEQ